MDSHKTDEGQGLFHKADFVSAVSSREDYQSCLVSPRR